MNIAWLAVIVLAVIAFLRITSPRQTAAWSCLVMVVRTLHFAFAALDGTLARIDDRKADRS